MKKSTTKLRHLLSFTTCFLMILSISLQRDGKWLGNDLKEHKDAEQKNTSANASTVMPDGTIVINTSSLSKDIIGYSGNTPLEIHLKDNKITEVKALSNQETPEFFNRARVLLTKWNGMTVQEARELNVDAVTGATMTSRAIIGNMKRGLQFAQNDNAKESFWEQFDSSPKALIGLLVALMAAILPLVYNNKKYRIIQQILNVSVLGLWCGTFLSYSSLIGFMSNGINVIALMVPTILLITAFIYPFFGKKTYYCTHVCPFGSLQEITGKCVKYKIKISTKMQKRLNMFRQLLWAILMICLWTGLWSEWIDYEPFSAFIFGSASWIVISIAITFTLLSSVITRPYCRFVCPTGTLLHISQTSK